MKETSLFVNIKTVFERPEDRNIKNLISLYENMDFLKSLISEMVDDRLKDEMIIGKRVLLKPNWVLHNRKEDDELCMRTHNNFLLAALEIVLIKRPVSVLIGDAPIQGCKWDEIISPHFIKSVQELENKYQIPIVIKDFRRVTFDPSTNNLTIERNPLEDYVIFDLGKHSYLDPISKEGKKLFRVTDYDPDRLAQSHRPGVHKYCISKEIFENDVIITIPKVKTHQKAGVTNALKILVGINGDKDFLPHHRKGGTANGGDCYPGSSFFLYLAEEILDIANRRRGKFIYKYLRYLPIILWKLSNPSPKHNLAAAWHGNDTTWRMTLDLNKIAEFGTKDGIIADKPQRILFSLCDGIVGGQGDGPLNADPLNFGIVCFSNISSFADAAITVLLGFEIKKIPLVKFAIENDKEKDVKIFYNNKLTDLNSLTEYATKTVPPPGWIGYL